MTHEAHPTFDEDGIILHDDCERCLELAAKPVYNLSERYLFALWELMLAHETNWDGPRRYLPPARQYALTQAEVIGISSLWAIYLFLERHTTVDPKELVLK